MSALGVALFVTGAFFVGSTIGLVVGGLCRDAARADDDDNTYRALRAVQQENGGLSETTRQIVLRAIFEHESRGFK